MMDKTTPATRLPEAGVPLNAESEVSKLWQMTDPFNGGVSCVESWPEGLVLWHEGEIVWRSWGPKAPRPVATPAPVAVDGVELARAIAELQGDVDDASGGHFVHSRKSAVRTILAALTTQGEGEGCAGEADAGCDAEAVSWIRIAAKEITGGNCAFVDDDLRVLSHLAQRAVDAGLTDQLSPDVQRHALSTRPSADGLAVAVEALAKFAAVGRLIAGPFGPLGKTEDDDPFVSGCAWLKDGVKQTLTWGDFRRAAAALATLHPAPDQPGSGGKGVGK